MSSTVITFALLAITVFWALGAHNRLVRLRSQVAQHLQQLVQLWESQAQAIGVRLEQYAQGRETESQWATLDDDALRWRPLTLAARQFLACLSVLRGKAQQIAAVDDVSSVRAARDIFEAAWQRLTAEQEDLAGTPVPPANGTPGWCNRCAISPRHSSAVAGQFLRLRLERHAVELFHH